jgi:hypothetical protein
MALVNPIYSILSQAEAPPRDAFIDSFNANNLMLSCYAGYMKDCRRSSIIGSSNSALMNKFNTHVIAENYQSQDFQIIDIYNNILNLSRRYYIEYLGDDSRAYDILNNINTTLSKNYSIDWAQVDEDVFYVHSFVSGGSTYYFCRLSDDFVGIKSQLEQRITYSSDYDLTFANFGVDGYLLEKSGNLLYSSLESVIQDIVSQLNYICQRNLVSENGTIIKEYSWSINNVYENFEIYDYKSLSHRLYISAKNGLKIQSPLNKNSLSVGKSRDINSYYDVIANNASDIRLKDNVLKISNSSGKINNLSAVSFVWNNRQASHSGDDIGLIAQQVEKQFPEITTTRDNGVKAINYKKMTAILVACIKEKQQRIDSIKEKINKLKNGTK